MSNNVNKKFIESQKEKKKSFNKIRIKFKTLIWLQLYYFFIYNYIKNLNYKTINIILFKYNFISHYFCMGLLLKKKL